MATEQAAPSKDNPLVRALARWEWEGGYIAPDGEKRAPLAQEEEHILQWLGAAVVTRWNELPTDVQRQIFASAVAVTEPLPSAELKEHIARFLHSHKGHKGL